MGCTRFVVCALALVAGLAAVIGVSAHGGGGEPSPHDPSHGFNSAINWQPTFDDAKRVAAEQNKPIALLIHKSWCGACQNLKKQFAGSTKIVEATNDYVMVNTEDDEEPVGGEYTPDGGYIPRLLFLTADGRVRPEVINTAGNPKYKYFYADENSVLNRLKTAKDELVAIATKGDEPLPEGHFEGDGHDHSHHGHHHHGHHHHDHDEL